MPGLFDAVRTHGGVFWDGLLSQNPPVRKLVWSRPDEIWIIQINPRRRTTEPRTAAEIRRIELGEGLDAVSKLDRSAALIGDLMARGEAEAEQFLASLPVR